MDIIAWDQNIIRKKAIESCIAITVALGLQLIIVFLDRTTQGYVNLLVFWPLVVFSLIQAIGVAVYYKKHFKSARLLPLLLTIPVYAFWVYVLVTLIKGY